MNNKDWLIWIKEVMEARPKNNAYLDSERGIEVGKLCIDVERELFSFRRSDVDTFWIDVQLFIKYKLSDDDIRFVLKMQPGINAYWDNGEERKAYAEMMRGLEKLKRINSEKEDKC